MLKLALFDLDGTLMDTEGQYTIFWGEMARKYRPDIPQLEHKIKGQTLVQIYATYFPDPQVQQEITAGLNKWEMNMNYEFMPGAVEFVQELKSKGVTCAIVTSSNQAKISSAVKKAPQLGTLFDRIFTSEDFTTSKPAPDCYLLGAKTYGCSVNECVVFEDAYNGLKSGMAANMLTIGITTTIPRDTILNHCNYAIDGYHEINFEKVESLLKQTQ